jgi:hypothetical protein
VGVTSPLTSGISEQSLNFLIRWLNTNVLRSPIHSFPKDIVNSNGRPIFDMIESLGGRGIPGRLGSRLPSGHLRKTQALYNEARDLLTFLKSFGAFVHHVRPEQLLNRDAYLTVRVEPKSVGVTYGAPMLETKNERAMQIRRSTIVRKYPVVARDAWLAVTLQVVKLFALSRVSLKHLSTLAGMPLVPELEPPAPAPAAPAPGAGKRPAGKGPKAEAEQTEAEIAAAAKLKAKLLSPDAALTGSNFMNVSECLLLRWLGCVVRTPSAVV